MPLLSTYTVPGLHVEDHSIAVPLDWSTATPGEGFTGEQLSLFYRVLCAPDKIHEDLPVLLFLQGGPGGAGPRPLNESSDGWIAQAIRHFRIVLPDQRGTGRSSHVDGNTIAHMTGAEGSLYLKRFLADSIIRDFEHLRLTEFNGIKWTTLGQSYGGFLTLTYLSLFPHALAVSFTTGGIPHVPGTAKELYEHTFVKMANKTRQFYARYPQDAERIAVIADRLVNESVTLPNGDPFTVERLQTLGQSFGMKPGFEEVHWMLDEAFADGDGSISDSSPLTDQFLFDVMVATNTHPLYWPLQEFIYANGELDEPINWAAAHVYDQLSEFSTDHRPLMLTGEAIFPWMFRQERQLLPFRAAVDEMMQSTEFGTIYLPDVLERNEVPLEAAVYFDDMYVPSELSLDTLSRIGNAHAWVTNAFEHDGVHGSQVFAQLFQQALDRGDLDSLL